MLSLRSLFCQRKDGSNITHELVCHKTEDSHHGCTAIVQFNSTLLLFPCVRLLIPSKIDEAISEVTSEFLSSSEVLSIEGKATIGHFHYKLSSNHLGPNHTSNFVEGSKTTWYVLCTREADTSIGDKVSNNCKHSNTAVLQLDVASRLKFFFVNGCGIISKYSEGVVETKGSLDTEGLGGINCLEGSRSLSGLGWCKGGSRADKEGGGDELHLGLYFAVGGKRKKNCEIKVVA
mmetsp:Transcript_32989/g.48433  ORF Transcript_32989/g.48433 Transcript_32989/m.48433 type:complete len:233 (-) Transcript_32989:105-803(-)